MFRWFTYAWQIALYNYYLLTNIASVIALPASIHCLWCLLHSLLRSCSRSSLHCARRIHISLELIEVFRVDKTLLIDHTHALQKFFVLFILLYKHL